MQALFIGQTYIDVTFITDHMPTGDEKHVASAYAVSFGGNAVTAAFCCAKLGIVPDLIATVANDWLGRMFQDMSAKYGISIHPRKGKSSSLSFIMPKDGKRAIVLCRSRASACSTPMAPVTCFMALTCFRISTIPGKAGTTISSLLARPRPTRSNASAMRPDCRHLPISKPSSRNFRSGARRNFGIRHGARLRCRQHQYGCGGDGRPPSPHRPDGHRKRSALLSRWQGRQTGGRPCEAGRAGQAYRPRWPDRL